MSTVTIDPYSMAAVPIVLYFDDPALATPTKLGTATAFFWSHDGKIFLVTNWHNLSGRNPITGAHINPETAAEPNRMEVGLNLAGQIGQKVNAPLPIRDERGMANWWIHPEHGRNVDIAILPVAPDARFDFYPINELRSVDMKAEVGADVFILGFPLGPHEGYPVWKRGSIASEPELLHDQRLYTMVDTASRPGMSGSPVVLRRWGSYTPTTGPAVVSGGIHTKFLGIYSGRLATSDQFDAQLGMVWHQELIVETIRERRRDDSR